jgi:hypothetical protein
MAADWTHICIRRSTKERLQALARKRQEAAILGNPSADPADALGVGLDTLLNWLADHYEAKRARCDASRSRRRGYRVETGDKPPSDGPTRQA